MDFKDAKTQKIVLGIMAFFIVGYFWYSRLYTKHDLELTQKNQEFETITTNLRNVEMKAKSLEALKTEYTDLLARYHQIEALLPEVKQIPSFLVQLHTASSLTGTRITGVQPLPIESKEFYNIASYELSMTGTYHDVGSFVSYVANFPFITNVSDVNVTALDVAIGEAEYQRRQREEEDVKSHETISAVFTLSTYYVKEEERLQELVL